MQPRPQSRSRKPGFPDLVKKVLGAEKCSGCAACAASCPYGVLGYRGERPELDGECRFCGICAKVCHKYEFDRGKVEKSFLGRERLDSEPFGVARKIVAARSADREIRKHAQDGGVATALLAKALEDGLIDAALLSCADRSKPWVPRPRIASTRDEIIACSGTRYSYSPNLLLLPDAVKEGFEKIALVGTPCTISGFRKLQLLGLRRLVEPVKLLVGLMCFECFDHGCLLEGKVAPFLGVEPSSVRKINIKGKLLVELSDGSIKQVPLEEVKHCARKSCLACDDFSSEYADVSLGGIGLSGSTLAIARSKLGEGLLSITMELLEAEGERILDRSLSLVERMSRAKRERAANFEMGKGAEAGEPPP